MQVSDGHGLFRWRHARIRAAKVSLATGDIQVDAEGWFPNVLDPRDEARLRDLVTSGSKSYERVALNSEAAYTERIKAAEANLAAAQNEAQKAEAALQYAYDVATACQRRLDDLNAEKKRYQDMAETALARAEARAQA